MFAANAAVPQAPFWLQLLDSHPKVGHFSVFQAAARSPFCENDFVEPIRRFVPNKLGFTESRNASHFREITSA
jgi:hypothetical protein